MTQRLKERYFNLIETKELVPNEKGNIHTIPKLNKIVINRGVGSLASNPRALENCAEELTQITGQKATIRNSKKAIAAFKIREDMPVGISVTLRGDKMYAFLDRLINLALPRVRDFQGISPKGFDGQGNYNLGLKEQLMFPEVEYDSVDEVCGMDISIVTTSKNNEQGLSLLKGLGMPFSIKL